MLQTSLDHQFPYERGANDERGKWGCDIKSPLKSLPSVINFLKRWAHSNDDQGKLENIREWWAREVDLKKSVENHIFLYPASAAVCGSLDSSPSKSSWKKPTFGTSPIEGTQGDQIEKWPGKYLFFIVKSRLLVHPTSNYLGLGPFLRHFRAELGNSIWLQLIFMSKPCKLSQKSILLFITQIC